VYFIFGRREKSLLHKEFEERELAVEALVGGLFYNRH
jgi:hypothetical protein